MTMECIDHHVAAARHSLAHRAMPLDVEFIAVVSATNAPMYFKVFARANGMDIDSDRAMSRAHAALDAVDARMRDAALQSSSSSRDESYLGEVFRAHDGAAYGYATGTRARFVLGVSDEGSRAVDEREMRRTFDALAEAYSEAVCDAFSERCGRLEGERWRRRVDALLS